MCSIMTNVAKNKVIASETGELSSIELIDFLVLFSKCEAELITLSEKVSRVLKYVGSWRCPKRDT